MSHYVPMYDNVGHQVRMEQAKSTPSAKAIVTSNTDLKYYAKLSPETLLRQRTECEDYQVPAINSDKKSAPCQMKSNLLTAVIGLLFILLLMTSLILASIEWKKNNKLSAQLQEMHNEMAKMKREVMNLRERLMQTSFDKCLKDIVREKCYSSKTMICETASLYS